MSNDNDNLMSCAAAGDVLESEDANARKSRLGRDRVRKHRKLHPNKPRKPRRPRSALTGEELERIRTQGRDNQRRYSSRKKKKQNAAAKIEAQQHAGNIDIHNVDHVVGILSTAKKRKHEDDDITNHGTHDVDGESRVNPSGQDVDLSTVVEKVARKSVRDDGSREENMDVADVGAAVEDIGNNGHTDIVGNTTTGNNNNDDGVTSENAAGHNDGAVREATVNNNSLSQNSQRGSRRTTGRSHNDGITSKNATGHNNGAVRQGTVNNNSSSDNSRHSTTTCR